jgi:hypothetical protein
VDKELDIYEFEWWGTLIGLTVLFLFSGFLIGSLYSILQSHPKPSIHNLQLVFFPMIILTSSLLTIMSVAGMVILILFVPRMIVFRQNSITIRYAIRRDKTFSYEDISRLVLRGKAGFSYKSAPRLCFRNKTIVFFNPDRMFDFHSVLETIRNKGLSSVVERM